MSAPVVDHLSRADCSAPISFWAREHTSGAELLKLVRRDLEEVISVCSGEARQTNHNRALLSDLTKGEL